jgi:Laminin G domain
VRVRQCPPGQRDQRARGCRAGVALLTVQALAFMGCQRQIEDDDPAPDPSPVETVEPTSNLDPRARDDTLHLRFSPGHLLANSGSAPLRVRRATWGGGRIRQARAPHGPAVRLPAFRSTDPGFATIRVDNLGAPDRMRPDDGDFAFGASFSLDRISDGSAADNGDNLIQRGLFESPSQYKIQLDKRRVSCLVRGLDGGVVVEGARPVRPERWYRVKCVRRGEGIVLKIAAIDKDGRGRRSITRQRGPIGAVTMPLDTPLSIGGKLAGDGTLRPTSTDQFNGAVARVFLRVPTPED